MRLDGFRRRLARPGVRSSPPSETEPSTTTALDAFLRTLHDLIQRMDRSPPTSFAQSFLGEFDSLQRIDRDAVRNMSVEFESCISAENTLKNRYPNIYCNEGTRFKLRDVPAGEHDYINANCISGFGSHPGYIATQAPLPGTMSHFWQMVFEESCPVIVMLTREQEVQCYYPKCNRYWPAPDECVLFGRYYVLGLGERTNESSGIIERRFRVGKTIRRDSSSNASATTAAITTTSTTVPSVDPDFQTPVRRPPPVTHDAEPIDEVDLEQDGEAIEVTQIQYIDWPDQGVPEYADTLLKICAMVDDLCKPRGSGRPIIHCSAGVGRTGTFIAVHKSLQAVYSAFPGDGTDAKGSVPIVEDVVSEMKRERSKMVQTAEQYRFIFIALAEGVELYRNQIMATRAGRQ